MTKNKANQRSGIGTLNEFSLHAEIIQHLSQPGDQMEAQLEGYFIDILRGDKIIEVQTRNLGKLLPKAHALAKTHTVEVIYPIQQHKTITRVSAEGELVSKRKSPKSGRLVDVFDELVNAPSLITPENVTLKILLIEGVEIWKDDGKGSWRRKGWSIAERRLTGVRSERIFSQPTDLLELLPRSLPSPFTNAQLAKLLKIRSRLAGKITYTLRKLELLTVVDRQGNAYLFEVL
ncbi:hypothetical protein KQH54_01540 [bacterium]|nr:hypothetical protein [bacterium]